MDRAASLPRLPRSSAAVLPHLGATSVLALLVAASAVGRGLAALLKATPDYFPDEYLYAQLGRSIADTGRPLVRGASAHFPALLQPLLTAPAWLVGDTATAYRMIQVAGAVAMSLAAIPVFVLATRLGLGRAPALLVAGLSLALPDLLYASWIVAEPFAYPLVLGAVAAGTLALAHGGRRAQLAFAVLAAAAAFARLQFVVLPFCFALAALLLGLGTRSLRRVAREQAPVLLLVVAPLGAVLAASPYRLLGVYGATVGVDVHPGDLAHRLAANGLGLAYASGWILVPGALLGLAQALARPRRRTEMAFGALVLPFVLALLAEASLYGDLDRIQERYVFYAVPLVGILFALHASHGWPWRRAHALAAAGAVCLAAAVPLSGYAASVGKTQSPFLFAVFRLEEALGTASGALLVGLLAGALSLVAIGLSLRPRVGGTAVLGLACAACAAASVGATSFDVRNTDGVRNAFLPADRAWVDAARLGDVTLIHGGALTTDTLSELIWNPSIRRVTLLPGAAPPDTFRSERLSVGRDGVLAVRGVPLRGAVLVDEWATFVRLHDAREVAASPTHRLWLPHGAVRLALYVPGYYRDGWLGSSGSVHLWPETPGGALAGSFSFVASVPAAVGHSVSLTIVGDGRSPLRVRVPVGASRRIELRVCARGSWAVGFQADRPTLLGERAVSVRATTPSWRPAPSDCATRLA